jgi:hypothetical protein
MAGPDLTQFTDLGTLIAAIAGVTGLFWAVFQYRQGQIERRKTTLFELVEDFDSSDAIKPAKMILDDYYLNSQDGWQVKSDRYYGRENLKLILRDHKTQPVSDPGEIAIRDSFDALLDFFSRLGYLMDIKLVKKKELTYFRYYIERAKTNPAVKQYTGIYEFPLFQKLLDQLW